MSDNKMREALEPVYSVPRAKKTAILSDDEIIAAANGWREYDAPDGLSPIQRMVYGSCRAAIAAHIAKQESKS